jgi:Xaa-Pro aminopeptidase
MSNLANNKIQAVREQLASWEVEGVLITQNHNYRWLSGFTGSSCVLLVTAEQALLGTDFR